MHTHVGIDNATWKCVIGQLGDPDISKNVSCYCSSVPPIDCA